MQPQRQIAKYASITEILFGKYIKEEGWQPNYILTENNRKLSRVNIIGTIVNLNKEENTLTLDDGQASITARTFEEKLPELNIGDTVQIIGRPREFNNEKYLIIEIIKQVDPAWIKVRKQELKEIKPEEVTVDKVEEVIVDEITVEDEFEKVMNIIRKEDSGMGVDTQFLIDQNIKEDVLNKLLENGEIFEISPGKVKILE